jgi:glycosyltransferase involved in cell wall biosynthesis
MAHPRVILHLLPTLALGGGQALVLRTAAAGDRQRFRHIVCHVRRPDEMSPAFLARGILTHCLDVRGPSSQPAAMARLFRLVAREKVDLVHTNNTLPDLRFGLTAAAAFRLPAVNTLHTEEVIGAPDGAAARLQQRLLDAAARRALKRAVAVSPAARQAWLPRKAAMGRAPDDVAVVTPGVERPSAGESDRAQARRCLGLRDEQPVLIHVGRLVASKGQRTLIDLLPSLLAQWPDLVLLLVGDGPDREALRAAAAAASLDGAARFLGSRGDVPDLLAAADLFVFPSLTEGFGLAPLEALASGVPVVAFDLPTLRRFVLPHQTGALVPRGDAAALARAVEALLADPASRAAFATRGRELAMRDFNIRDSAAAMDDLYDHLLANHGHEHGRTHARPAAHLN